MAKFPILEKVSVGLGGVDGLFLVHELGSIWLEIY